MSPKEGHVGQFFCLMTPQVCHIKGSHHGIISRECRDTKINQFRSVTKFSLLNWQYFSLSVYSSLHSPVQSPVVFSQHLTSQQIFSFNYILFCHTEITKKTKQFAYFESAFERPQKLKTKRYSRTIHVLEIVLQFQLEG